MLAYSFSFFFIKFAYYGVYYWVPTYLQDELGYSKEEAGNITSLGSVGGIIGSMNLCGATMLDACCGGCAGNDCCWPSVWF